MSCGNSGTLTQRTTGQVTGVAPVAGRSFSSCSGGVADWRVSAFGAVDCVSQPMSIANVNASRLFDIAEVNDGIFEQGDAANVGGIDTARETLRE